MSILVCLKATILFHTYVDRHVWVSTVGVDGYVIYEHTSAMTLLWVGEKKKQKKQKNIFLKMRAPVNSRYPMRCCVNVIGE